ncbi:MAG TPA: 2-amino-4-hydroxy-6-hydroxymethyldihydropteridine diphosphokinase [Tepidisphaeraceae bacterium]|jgi:2-amino-4-hydroxy-6-hydroxymethyldihydropteridine diphosphokinase|nr:2-amino-4-hydroxy-6-hydroxymethyldihydropteridine diphosphokinase [Tepidisphaeraceae bacterium]
MPTVRAFIALGANLGDREANIRRALAALDAVPDIRVIQGSPLLENPAVGGPPDSPTFLNAVAEIETSLEPEPLLDRLLEIERQLGRVRKHKWEPRVIDLDILLYGDEIIQTPALQIPHPLMHQRPFVLQPLAQIAPDVIHPVTNKSIAELLRSL